MNKTLSPPSGYGSWLDYAIATMDVRSVQLEKMFADTADFPPNSEDICAAPQADLNALLLPAKNVEDRTGPSGENIA